MSVLMRLMKQTTNRMQKCKLDKRSHERLTLSSIVVFIPERSNIIVMVVAKFVLTKVVSLPMPNIVPKSNVGCIVVLYRIRMYINRSKLSKCVYNLAT